MNQALRRERDRYALRGWEYIFLKEPISHLHAPATVLTTTDGRTALTFGIGPTGCARGNAAAAADFLNGMGGEG